MMADTGIVRFYQVDTDCGPFFVASYAGIYFSYWGAN